MIEWLFKWFKPKANDAITPWNAFVATGQVDDKDIPVDSNDEPCWDWRAALPGWVFNRMSYAGYPESWDRCGDGLPFVMFEHSGADRSRKIATTWDDEATGLFYYRDWTSSGTPIVRTEEKYWSGFWFEKRYDAELFHIKHGGIANWQEGFEKKRKAMNDRR